VRVLSHSLCPPPPLPPHSCVLAAILSPSGRQTPLVPVPATLTVIARWYMAPARSPGPPSPWQTAVAIVLGSRPGNLVGAPQPPRLSDRVAAVTVAPPAYTGGSVWWNHGPGVVGYGEVRGAPDGDNVGGVGRDGGGGDGAATECDPPDGRLPFAAHCVEHRSGGGWGAGLGAYADCRRGGCVDGPCLSLVVVCR